MTTTPLLRQAPRDRCDVASVVAAASRAPSVHNTQPWRWTFDGDTLDLRADRSRQLRVADRDLLARYTLSGRADPGQPAAGQPAAATMLATSGARRSERRVFGPQAVPPEVIDRLRVATASSGAFVHFPSRPDESLDLAVAVSSAADRSQRADGEPRHTDVPLRDFEAGIAGGQLIQSGIDERPPLAVIFTASDLDADRLASGRAMMRLMIQSELDGVATCPLSQSVDLLAFRTRLRTLMSWTGHPQMMPRLGGRPAGEPAPLTPRRPVDDVLTTT